MVLRFTVLILCFLAAYTLLIFHLYELQVVKGDYYLARAQSEYLASDILKAQRGIIYFTDKNGSRVAAALNKDFPLIYAAPKDVSDPKETANILAPILNRPEAELKTILSKASDPYEILAKKADSDTVQKISNLGLNGVYITSETDRFYPLGAAAAQVLGFVGPSKNTGSESGHYGLEEFYDAGLTGKSGDVSNGKIISPTAGRDLAVTIDPNIQIEAEQILNNLANVNKAAGGSIIVAEPQTGKILAMAGLPGFDPNNYGISPLANLLNPVTQKIYEPGSVFKVITMAAGIDSGKITPDTTYFDTGSVTLNGRTIQNYDIKTHGPYGKSTMTNVIEHSINTGAVFAERQIGRDIFTSYLTKFGFSEKTGVDLPAEISGDLRRLSPKERDIAFATASYGQGVAVTPLELISAVSAIANGGDLLRPYLNADLEPQIIRRVISENTAKKVAQMMVSAVDKAEVAKIGGFTVAGKTGTAFIPDFKNGGYTDNVIDSYVGFAPASNPRFIALVKIDSLPSASLAAQTVVPAFRDLAQFILNYYDVAPDRIQ